jgi:hypothetical protein
MKQSKKFKQSKWFNSEPINIEYKKLEVYSFMQ